MVEKNKLYRIVFYLKKTNSICEIICSASSKKKAKKKAKALIHPLKFRNSRVEIYKGEN